MQFYCLEIEETDNYIGWFTSKDLLKEYYEACLKAYPRVKHKPVLISIPVDYNWKDDLLEGNKPKSIFPKVISEVEF